MSKRFIPYATLLLAALFLALAPATDAGSATSPLADKVLQLQQRYSQLHSLEFEFAQTTLTSGRSRLGKGNAVFLRPAAHSGRNGIMRWNYTEPQVQTIINNGTELSIYTPEDKQLLITTAQELESDITYAIISGTRNLLDEFEILAADPGFTLNATANKEEAALLLPRQAHPQIKRIQIWFDKAPTITRLLLEDHFGALTELSFSNMRLNTLPADDAGTVADLLRLDLAPGTETIRQ